MKVKLFKSNFILKKVGIIITIVMIICSLFSCKSTDTENQESIFSAPVTSVKKYPEIMFWEVSGIDKDNNPSTVYILGTIHIADSALYPVPQKILKAFNESDTAVGEISTEGWASFQDEVNVRVADALNLDGEKQLADLLTEDDIQLLVKYFGEELSAQLLFFDPWVLNNTLSAITFDFSNLEPMQSYDMYFIEQCGVKLKKMDGLDDLSVQLDLISFGDWDFQFEMLRDSLDSVKNPEESIENIRLLYDAYLSGDESKLENALFSEMEAEIEKNPLYEDYYNAMFKNRNIDWAGKIKNYLNQGGKTFIFAGAGHFVGPDSVFTYLK